MLMAGNMRGNYESSFVSYSPSVFRQDSTCSITATLPVVGNYSNSRQTNGIPWVAKASRVPSIPPSGEGDGRTNI